MCYVANMEQKATQQQRAAMQAILTFVVQAYYRARARRHPAAAHQLGQPRERRQQLRQQQDAQRRVRQRGARLRGQRQRRGRLGRVHACTAGAAVGPCLTTLVMQTWQKEPFRTYKCLAAAMYSSKLPACAPGW